MSQVSLFMRMMCSSIAVANHAGVIIRDIMKKGELGIIDKGTNDLQTEADRSAQRCIIASLSKQFPNVQIIGEEGLSDLTNVPTEWIIDDCDKAFLTENKCPDLLQKANIEDFVIWVDPLDGTNEYTQGFLHHVTVLIGIAYKNEAFGGVIHQPYFKAANGSLGRTIWGVKGLGTGGFIPKDLPTDKLIVITTRSHSTTIVQNALDALKPTEIIRVGGAGYKVLQLLEGIAHAYVFASAGCKKWDTCAPEAILEAHGGKLTDMLGRHYGYGKTVEFPNKSGVLATARNISHEEIVNKLPNNVKESMNKL